MKIIIYTIVLAFSVQTFARSGKGLKALDDLSLTSQQIEKVEQFKLEHKKKRKLMMGTEDNHREKMKQLFIEGASDGELRKLHETIKNYRSSHAEMKLEKMIFLKNLLSEDQRKAYIEKVKGHHKGKMKRRHGKN
jgi:hypothetical protein